MSEGAPREIITVEQIERTMQWPYFIDPKAVQWQEHERLKSPLATKRAGISFQQELIAERYHIALESFPEETLIQQLEAAITKAVENFRTASEVMEVQRELIRSLMRFQQEGGINRLSPRSLALLNAVFTPDTFLPIEDFTLDVWPIEVHRWIISNALKSVGMAPQGQEKNSFAVTTPPASPLEVAW
ncbi:MAG: hypothetical protein UW70_C0061G0005 [Candidatus Peregrinibacteria bacterium GW2011_GWA2_44_7]|nr:MAG: hypothetical protein UW70_C0061G0005 [Candidatus Peregrinibacteria bacterium GW2011_GWA2_44_7]